jgi:hypothetical protein
MITCQECEAEFEITHDNISEPEFCPFCAAKLRYDDEGLEEEDGGDDWYPDP